MGSRMLMRSNFFYCSSGGFLEAEDREIHCGSLVVGDRPATGQRRWAREAMKEADRMVELEEQRWGVEGEVLSSILTDCLR